MTPAILPAAVALLLLAVAPEATAQASAEAPLSLDGAVAPDGASVTLDWSGTERVRVADVAVARRRLGETGAGAWRTIAPSLGRALRFTDDTVRPRVAYEYRVTRSDRDVVDVGYWAAGTDLPAIRDRGHVHLVVDASLADALAPRLDRLEADLAGDGWRADRLAAPRGEAPGSVEDLTAAAAIREALAARHAADPFAPHAAILIGRVPIVMSGQAAPDGHEPRRHATDLFYGDLDGRWAIDAAGTLRDDRLPGDAIEMQVGRIDFAGLAGGDADRELHLLRAYLDRNHHWRHGLHGDLRRAYGEGDRLAVELDGLRNVVGPDALTEGGHHDAGEDGPWLWGVDFGDHAGSRYAEEHSIEAVFAINFGSGKQAFQATSNALTATLAQPWYPVAVGWGARPSWRLHPMALGGTVGDAHMRTVNNGVAARPYRETMDYYPTGQYLWRNPIWVNLLGDPTVRAFPLAPPPAVRAEAGADGVTVSWTPSADPDATGHEVHLRRPGDDRYRLASGDVPLEGSAWRDPSPEPGTRYMVRASGLKRVHAGSFNALSQGRFAEVGRAPPVAADLRVAGRANEAVALPPAFDDPGGGPIHAVVEGPDRGALRHDGDGWRYVPEPGFAGTVTLRYTVSDGFQTDEGMLAVVVE